MRWVLVGLMLAACGETSRGSNGAGDSTPTGEPAAGSQGSGGPQGASTSSETTSDTSSTTGGQPATVPCLGYANIACEPPAAPYGIEIDGKLYIEPCACGDGCQSLGARIVDCTDNHTLDVAACDAQNPTRCVELDLTWNPTGLVAFAFVDEEGVYYSAREGSIAGDPFLEGLEDGRVREGDVIDLGFEVSATNSDGDARELSGSVLACFALSQYCER